METKLDPMEQAIIAGLQARGYRVLAPDGEALKPTPPPVAPPPPTIPVGRPAQHLVSVLLAEAAITQAELAYDRDQGENFQHIAHHMGREMAEKLIKDGLISFQVAQDIHNNVVRIRAAIYVERRPGPSIEEAFRDLHDLTQKSWVDRRRRLDADREVRERLEKERRALEAQEALEAMAAQNRAVTSLLPNRNLTPEEAKKAIEEYRQKFPNIARLLGKHIN